MKLFIIISINLTLFTGGFMLNYPYILPHNNTSALLKSYWLKRPKKEVTRYYAQPWLTNAIDGSFYFVASGLKL